MCAHDFLSECYTTGFLLQQNKYNKITKKTSLSTNFVLLKSKFILKSTAAGVAVGVAVGVAIAS